MRYKIRTCTVVIRVRNVYRFWLQFKLADKTFGGDIDSQNGDNMDLNFILIAGGITIAWIGLVVFYMRVVSRQRKLYQELRELDRQVGLESKPDEE